MGTTQRDRFGGPCGGLPVDPDPISKSSPMRSEEEIKTLILDFAEADHRIRAVLLNGSRANPKAATDKFQDFDIVYVVTDMEPFTSDHNWTAVFGKPLIRQLPDAMVIGNEAIAETGVFHYLMLFEDGNRIDLTLFPIEKLSSHFHIDSLTLVWLDKDALFTQVAPPDERDYWILRPTEKVFQDTCNEFWWVSTYVAKGLWRDEVIYAKQMLEVPVRTMFLKILEWHIGTQTDFTTSFGKGRNIKKYVSATLYEQILSTYPDSKTGNIWNALFIMTALFSDLAKNVAQTMDFQYNEEEGQRVTKYLNGVFRSAS
jgi:aminoglycoside 6-adenylyltransferase